MVHALGVFCSWIVAIILALPMTLRQAEAAGLAVEYQSPSSAARAGVGSAVGFPDASTVYYNPAGMTLVEAAEGSIALGVVFPRFGFNDAGSTDAIGMPMRSTGSLQRETWIVPSAFAVSPPLPGRLRAGIALTAPFGQSIAYDDGWVGRYFVTDAELTTANVSLALAWAPAEQWSVGGGVDWQRADLARAAAIDFGAVCLGTLDPALCRVIGLVPQGADGRIELSAKSYAWGYNLGLVFEQRGVLRAGLTYRSPFSHDLRGATVFDVPASATPLLSGGAFRATNVSGNLDLPESVSLGLQFSVHHAFDAILGATWSRWSRIREFVTSFDNPAQPPVRETLEWRDRTRLGVALQYRPRDGLTLQTGIAWDPTPVTDEGRQPYLPESDWVAFGAGLTWRASHGAIIAASYNYAYGRRVPILQSDPAAGTLSGSYKNHLQGFGISAALRF